MEFFSCRKMLFFCLLPITAHASLHQEIYFLKEQPIITPSLASKEKYNVEGWVKKIAFPQKICDFCLETDTIYAASGSPFDGKTSDPIIALYKYTVSTEKVENLYRDTQWRTSHFSVVAKNIPSALFVSRDDKKHESMVYIVSGSKKEIIGSEKFLAKDLFPHLLTDNNYCVLAGDTGDIVIFDISSGSKLFHNSCHTNNKKRPLHLSSDGSLIYHDLVTQKLYRVNCSIDTPQPKEIPFGSFIQKIILGSKNFLAIGSKNSTTPPKLLVQTNSDLTDTKSPQKIDDEEISDAVWHPDKVHWICASKNGKVVTNKNPELKFEELMKKESTNAMPKLLLSPDAKILYAMSPYGALREYNFEQKKEFALCHPCAIPLALRCNKNKIAFIPHDSQNLVLIIRK